MNLTILGCHSATPKNNTHTTSQLVQFKGNLFLVDCGEGTQVRLREKKVKFSRIKNIFISHLHGDHFYGLIGLIGTFRLMGRNTDLNIYGPKGIKELINIQLKLSKSRVDFGLYFHELTKSVPEIIFEDQNVKVSTIPLKHRIYTNGFLFEEKKPLRKLNYEILKKNNIPVYEFKNIKNGKDYINQKGEVVDNELITLTPKKPFKYAFCSDTGFYTKITNQIKNVNLLYHESTFLNEHYSLAKKTYHSTAEQAAKIASLANVEILMLGHFSTRYRDKSKFLEEAKNEFKNVILANEGETYNF
tara:strand:- start:23702 stop:24607 length:906 start_codon:yes stop_codon:yes gene_type:complete